MTQGYVDIHTHILPGIDDGSVDWQQTERMLQMQREQGVTDIIATPHFDMELSHQDPDHIRRLVAEANELAEEAAPGLTVYPGCEVLYTPGIMDAYRSGEILTLADSQYLLVEFFPQSSYREIEEAIDLLVREGLTPVIAHVERCYCLVSDYDRLYELTKMGALMQMNSYSLLGSRFDRRVKLCRRMAQKGFVHFLGSDCHNEEDRPPGMQESYEAIEKFGGEDMADILTRRNAVNILEKKYL